MNFNEFLNHLSNYEPGKDIEVIAKEYGISEVIKLASNENPFGVPPKAIESLKQNASKAYLYPDDSMIELKSKLAQKYKIKNENIIIGAGSDQIIEFAVHSKLNPQNAFLQTGVTFAMYEIYAKQRGAKCYKTSSITHDLKEFKTLYDKHKEEIKIIFLCLPNNPLGECLDADEVLEFIRDVDKDCLLVLDAAYNEFASFKDEKKHLEPYDLIKEFENVLFLGTFSKLYGLGGLRIGYGIANTQIINAFYKLRAPFNVSNLALKAAVAALDDEEFVKKTLKNNFSQMQLYYEFAKKHGIKTLQSYTNFITYFFDEKNSIDLSEKLLKKGIIIRNLKSYGLNAMRITIGTPYENEKFLTEMEKILKK
ncbi:histidinol-phosphate transaminase [Campylobacter sp. VicNov18]|uniref:histidinol-phosphate transaminase n=1 Tax=Campylobacter bilis TaxID=2691918 RepID=UPI00130DD5D2|nr:histidinol-phosphate transaminase [Campylobacter bilis]MPV63268.1 histidinol-phosphate transaminase [Campylobacter hepaticus]MBM0636767.1 histidinol-phosphate transaminase [Campylobacter bilis]MCC8277339.1 histidinol-phosphate transaminase [Campylobacter bilis]MCC8299082.1 histidinol-phosphate transaminase [Campylobacter bilis]MCC8300248.1 histidinol-phosphate transaminase [Campylobacter bilis]